MGNLLTILSGSINLKSKPTWSVLFLIILLKIALLTGSLDYNSLSFRWSTGLFPYLSTRTAPSPLKASEIKKQGAP